MGIIKTWICRTFLQRSAQYLTGPVTNTSLRTSLEKVFWSLGEDLQWSSLWSAGVFSIAAVNLVYPKLLTRRGLALLRGYIYNMGRVIFPILIYRYLWTTLNLLLLGLIESKYPGLPWVENIHVLLSLFALCISLWMTGFLQPTPPRSANSGFRVSRRVIASKSGLLDPYRRTRSGAVYGKCA